MANIQNTLTLLGIIWMLTGTFTLATAANILDIHAVGVSIGLIVSGLIAIVSQVSVKDI